MGSGLEYVACTAIGLTPSARCAACTKRRVRVRVRVRHRVRVQVGVGVTVAVAVRIRVRDRVPARSSRD